MAFCENCGMKIAEDAKFCENCGAPHMQAVSQQAEKNAAQTENTHSYSYSQSEQQETASSSYAGSSTYNSDSTYNTGSTYNTETTSYSSRTSGPLPMMGFMEAVQKCFSNYVK